MITAALTVGFAVSLTSCSTGVTPVEYSLLKRTGPPGKGIVHTTGSHGW